MPAGHESPLRVSGVQTDNFSGPAGSTVGQQPLPSGSIVREDFEAVRLSIDVAEFHDYAVDWTEERAVFSVDGEVIRIRPRPPAYPMRMTVAVFDFPDRSDGTDTPSSPNS